MIKRILNRIKKNEHNFEHYIMTLIITLLALTVIVCYSFGSFYNIAKNDAVTIGEKVVSEQSEKLNNLLLKGMDVMEVTGLTIDYMLKEGRTSEEIEDFLTKQSIGYASTIDENFTGIYGVFNDVYIDGIGWQPDEYYIPEERPWYKSAKDGKGKPVVVSPYLDAQTDTIMFSVSELLSDGKSVVSLDITMSEMQEYVQNIKYYDNGYGFILDKNGLVVAHSDYTQKGKNYLDGSVNNEEMRILAKSVCGKESKSFTMNIDNKNCMIFSKQVQEDWFVIMVIDTDELFNKVENTLIKNIIVSLLIYGVVVFFCTRNFINCKKAVSLTGQLRKYQTQLEEMVLKQTEEIKSQTKQILKNQENVIEGMATLIESRDGNTGEHVRNTKKYVSFIVKYMLRNKMHTEEIDNTFVGNICNAAPLHDVGKIMISDTILNKPGKFTKEEFEIMKTHSKIGAEIVENILGKNTDKELVKISKNVAHYHHERWDGKGYPDGLKGEEIPLCARIMAVADVFDALVSKRVYKESISIEEAFKILKEESGSHFDPEIIDVMINIRPKIEKYLKVKEKK